MSSQVRILASALAVALAGGLTAAAISQAAEKHPAVLSYTADGKLVAPADYRTWIYLSSGMDMAYIEGPPPAQHTFETVFVDPASYAAFQKTGTWPDKTVMVLEIRKGQTRGSITKAGVFQADRVGIEYHVKDVARFKSGWAFFPASGAALPQDSGCNKCHEEHAAVDTTFVQFYPTLIAKAQEMKTFSAAYLAEEAKAKP